jgi:hypothetical protein
VASCTPATNVPIVGVTSDVASLTYTRQLDVESYSVFVKYRGVPLRAIEGVGLTLSETHSLVQGVLSRAPGQFGTPTVTAIEVRKVIRQQLQRLENRNGTWVELPGVIGQFPFDRESYQPGSTWYLPMIHSEAGWGWEHFRDEESARALIRSFVQNGRAEMTHARGSHQEDVVLVPPPGMDVIGLLKVTTTSVARWTRHARRGLVLCHSTAVEWDRELGAA